MSTAIKEAMIYFEKNPTCIKEIEVGEISAIDLKRHVQKSGVTRNPCFGFPVLSYEKPESNFLTQCMIGLPQPKKLSPKVVGFFDDDSDE
jgi:hypothetical protein